MLSTKNLDYVTSLSGIPSSWIFEFYLSLPTSLVGQSIKIKSPFTGEKTPSFKIYYSSSWNFYMFKDFSGGLQGDGVRLVSSLFNLSRDEAKCKIINDFNSSGSTSLKTFSTPIVKVFNYEVSTFKIRVWTEQDNKFWSSFKIPLSLLKEYNVLPIDYFIMSKQGSDDLVFKGLIYGYFKKDGTLYKLYLPGRKTKFIQVCTYIQGAEQLKFESNTLIITSSLKDLLNIRVLFSNIESIAPDSENTYIPLELINYYKTKYKTILTLFDKDDAGEKAALKYKEQYGIESIYLNLEKDVSDSVKKYDLSFVRDCLISIIKPLL